MRETVITWSVPNIFTIALMMLIIGTVIGCVAKLIAGRMSNND